MSFLVKIVTTIEIKIEWDKQYSMDIQKKLVRQIKNAKITDRPDDMSFDVTSDVNRRMNYRTRNT